MATTEAQRIAALIDHTILRADATEQDVKRVCAEAREHGFASVCVNGYWVPLVVSELAGSSVKVCTVAGFPLGAMSTEAKQAETEIAIRQGAHEIDMVINVGALLSGERDSILREIATLAATCHAGGALLKVIIETCLLTDELKGVACRLAKDADADFVKTSTGFAKSGAAVEDVALMRDAVGDQIGVKASGGIRTLADLERMVAAGATRIGASASVAILQSLAGHTTE
jgi:deoxyribose-phosphate aldolase